MSPRFEKLIAACLVCSWSAVGCGQARTGEAVEPGSAPESGAIADEGATPIVEPGSDIPDVMLVCPQGGKIAGILVDFRCARVIVQTCKDLSNIVLEFEDGTRQRFEGLNGQLNAFSGTGANAGKRLVGVWVKAGANHSGDGPGYGQRFDSPAQACVPPAAGSGAPCVLAPDGSCLPPGGLGGRDAPCVPGPDDNCLPGGGIGGRDAPEPDNGPDPS